MSEKRLYRFEVPEGPIEVSLPAELSSESISDLEEWLEVTMKTILRRARKRDE
jgi:hypothetical protein